MFTAHIFSTIKRLMDRSRSDRPTVAIALALAVLLLSAAGSQAQPLMAIDPAASFVDCGETAYLDVTLGDVSDLQGFSFTFSIDPDIVSIVEILPGEGLGDAACDNVFEWSQTGNLLTVDMAFLGCSLDLTIPRPIIRIGFESGSSPGLSPVILAAGEDQLLRDSNNQPISFDPETDFTPGSIQNTCIIGSALVAVDPAVASVDCDDTTPVDITLANVADLQGFSLTFEFDPTMVNIDDVVAGAGLAAADCDNVLEWEVNGNLLTIDATLLGCTQRYEGAASIARIMLQSGGTAGISPLTLSAGASQILRDGDNQSIPFDPATDFTAGSVENTCGADLAITKAVDNPTPDIGDQVVFTLEVTNNGPSDATGIVVADLLPDGYTYVSDNSGGSYDNGTGDWTVGALAAAGNISLEITASVNASGDYLNVATVTGAETDPDTDNNTASAGTVPGAMTDLAITKAVDNPTPNVGAQVVFTLEVTNNGPSDATGVVVADLLPDGYTYVSDNSGGSYDNGTGDWTVGALAAAGNIALEITASVNAAGDYLNVATVTGAETDPDTDNNTASVATTPVAVADLAITKVVDNPTPDIGDQVVFTLEVTNNGPSDATGILAADLLPDGYTYVSDNSGGTYDNGTGDWTVGALAAAGNISLEITASVNAGGEYLNIATVTGTETDPDTSNNSAGAGTVPGALADLSITKGVDNPTPNVGDPVVFTLEVTNIGPSLATSVMVTDLLPDGYTYVSDTGAGSYDSGTGDWTIGELTTVDSAVLSITASINPDGNYLNIATVVGGQIDPNPGNNSASVTTTPVALADLAIDKSVLPETAMVGEEVVFTLEVLNTGPSNGSQVAVVDQLPSGYTYVSDNSGGSYNSFTGLWNIGPLAADDFATLEITAVVEAEGEFLNVALVGGVETDPDLANNQDSASILVNLPPIVTNPGDQSNQALDLVSLQIEASDPENEDLLFGALNLPDGLTIDPDTGLIAGTVTCDAHSGSPFSVEVAVEDPAGISTTINFLWTITPLTTPAPIADLQDTRIIAGNGDDGTTGIALTWTAVGAGRTVILFRKGYGAYPEYDDGGGLNPTLPADIDEALAAGWTEVTAVTEPGQIDEPSERDFWFYVAFVASECGETSAPSNLTAGMLNYHLGDVAGGTGDPPSGNNLVNTQDVSRLGFYYGLTSGEAEFRNDLDVGPTTNGSEDGRPLTDNVVDIEDLMIFGINYNEVSKSADAPEPADRNALTIFVPETPNPGGVIDVGLWLSAAGDLKGLSLPLTWNPDQVRPLGFDSGPLVSRQAGQALLLTPQAGSVDVVLLSTPDTGLCGEGLLATMKFEVLQEGDPGINLGEVVARNTNNQPIDLLTETRSGTPDQLEVPSFSVLSRNYPNPFNPMTTFDYGVARAGMVQIRVYNLRGQLMKELVGEMKQPGSYSVLWDGTDQTGQVVAAGVYLARMQAPDRTEVQRMTLIK